MDVGLSESVQEIDVDQSDLDVIAAADKDRYEIKLVVQKKKDWIDEPITPELQAKCDNIDNLFHEAFKEW